MKTRTRAIGGGDYKSSIEITRVIKETLALLDSYGWQQMYPVYGMSKQNDIGYDMEPEFIDVISLWEQNGERVRNHRIFKRGEQIIFKDEQKA
jgi:hypothetical protein